MTRVVLDIRKTLDQNAAFFFERAKKARRKLAGIDETIRRFKDELVRLEQAKEKALGEEIKRQSKKVRQKEWYEKFRWFFSSEGFLCIGGRDATTNEILIKKHAEKQDVVFHTELPGSPFFVVKTEGKKLGESTLQEVAQATAAYSKAWKQGLSSMDVYWVLPAQVSKTTRSGEFVGRGAFIITGKRSYAQVPVAAAVGVLPDGRVMGGPSSAVQKQCSSFVQVVQGSERVSSLAKRIAKILKVDDLDSVVAALPVGEVRLM